MLGTYGPPLDHLSVNATSQKGMFVVQSYLMTLHFQWFIFQCFPWLIKLFIFILKDEDIKTCSHMAPEQANTIWEEGILKGLLTLSHSEMDDATVYLMLVRTEMRSLLSVRVTTKMCICVSQDWNAPAVVNSCDYKSVYLMLVRTEMRTQLSVWMPTKRRSWKASTRIAMPYDITFILKWDNIDSIIYKMPFYFCWDLEVKVAANFKSFYSHKLTELSCKSVKLNITIQVTTPW